MSPRFGGPGEAFDHSEIEESALTEAVLREICNLRIEEIARASASLVEAVRTADRRDLAYILANLNHAELHVTDFTGC